MIGWTADALEARWSEADGIYYSWNTKRGKPVEKPGIGCLLPLYADPQAAIRHPALLDRLRTWLERVRYGVPSFCGPVWLVVNWMLIDGLRSNGEAELAERVLGDSLALVGNSGFAEYFNPLTGEALGGSEFSWTAAMYLFLRSL
jgi:hypothetical protein